MLSYCSPDKEHSIPRSSAVINVEDVGSGALEEIYVDAGGTGYEIGDTINFNTGTATAQVSVVNGGIAPEDNTTGMSATDHIVLEDETTKGDSYTGNKIVQESGSGNEGAGRRAC